MEPLVVYGVKGFGSAPTRLSKGEKTTYAEHMITDDLAVLLAVLPPRVHEAIAALPDRGDLLEIVLDLGRLPEADFPIEK